MGFTDYGFQQYGSFTVGLSPSNPNYMEYGLGRSFFNGSVNYLDNGFLRKEISWRFNGRNVTGLSSLNTNEAVGSIINEVGIGNGVTIGSTIWSRDVSAIGEKTNSYSVDVTFDVRFSRF